jgi:hypothetical protein
MNNRLLRSIIVVIIVITGSVSHVSGAVIQAISSSQSDVQLAINSAASGDTVRVPSGGTSAWASPIVINKPVQIIGPGADKLTIKWTGSYAFKVNNINNWRVSGFKFLTSTAQQVFQIVEGIGWRVDHNSYNNTSTTTTGNFVMTDVIAPGGACKGLVDNNYVLAGKVRVNNGSAGFVTSGYLWNDSLALGSDDAIYVEDNQFILNENRATNCMDANRGSKYVFRYNTVQQTSVQSHGLSIDSGGRGGRKWEVYGNVFNSIGINSWIAVNMRGGTGVIFGNDFTSVVNYNYPIGFSDDRSHEECPGGNNCDDNTTGNGQCDGDHQWDINEDSSGYPCRDQIGRSTDVLLWTSSGSQAPKQELVPVYIWSNYTAGVAVTSAYIPSNGRNKTHIQANRDYYDYTKPFDGTSGTGCGALASRPARCTLGVGYWATNQSCTNLSGMSGANPSTPLSGVLYKCSAPDTWLAHFTPYDYPHPSRRSDWTSDLTAPRNLRLVQQ